MSAANPGAAVAELAWHLAGLALSLVCLAVGMFVVCCVLGDRRRKREERRAEVEIARAHARRLAPMFEEWTDADDEAFRLYLRWTP